MTIQIIRVWNGPPRIVAIVPVVRVTSAVKKEKPWHSLTNPQ